MGMEVEKVKGTTELFPEMQESRTVTLKEENLSELLSNPGKKSKNSETKPPEINPAELQKEDKNFFLAHPKISLLGVGLIGLILFSIGRNPKNLAKVLKGTNKVVNPKYAEAEKIADEILTAAKNGKNPKLAAEFESALKIFKKPEYRCDMSLIMARLENKIKDQSIIGKEYSTALAELKKKANLYHDKFEKGLFAGKANDYFELSEIFYKENTELISKIDTLGEKIDIFSYIDVFSATSKSDIINKIAGWEEELGKKLAVNERLSGPLAELKKKLNFYLDEFEEKILRGNAGNHFLASEKFYNENKELIEKLNAIIEKSGEFRYFDQYSAVFHSYIRPCPKEFLPKNGIYFHGTRKSKLIYENGLSPFCSNQDMARELGAAIYTTPDIRVAGGFSRPLGTILPLKLSPDAKVAFVDEVMFSSAPEKVSGLILEYFGSENGKMFLGNSQLLEYLTRKLYMEAGYDAAYMHKAMKSGLLSGLSPDVNKILGRPQSQLAVLNGEKLEIIDRKLLARVSDTGAKFATFGNTMKYSFKLSIDILKFFFAKTPKAA